jgi:flagellar biosynthetic protein FliR
MMGIGEFMAFVLVLVRVGSMFAFLPFLGEGSVPAIVKALLALMMSVAIFPVTNVQLPPSAWQPLGFFLCVAAEVLYGALMGFCTQMVFQSLRSAGELISQEMGMALAAIADPLSEVETTVVGALCDTTGVLVFFAIGGHHLLIRALHASFAHWPLGAFLAPEFIKRMSLGAVTYNLALAFQLAAPLVLLGFMVTLIMAILARLIPEVNVLIIGFPARIGMGLIGLTLATPLVVRYGEEVCRIMFSFASAVAMGT